MISRAFSAPGAVRVGRVPVRERDGGDHLAGAHVVEQRPDLAQSGPAGTWRGR
jgi:hypothetical protein